MMFAHRWSRSKTLPVEFWEAVTESPEQAAEAAALEKLAAVEPEFSPAPGG